MEIESLEDVRNAAALEMEQLVYDRMREAAAEERDLSRMFSTPDTFRDSLGDEKYEQYLEASGQSTAVTVRYLLQGSAADNAGIQQGDRIRRYGDIRIYDEGDLLNALIEGTPGESVSVEVERDGTIFYVTVPRGPIGTSGISRRWP
jgi:S1-C subfamily serine protease